MISQKEKRKEGKKEKKKESTEERKRIFFIVNLCYGPRSSLRRFIFFLLLPAAAFNCGNNRLQDGIGDEEEK
jgi:hypothetical protein